VLSICCCKLLVALYYLQKNVKNLEKRAILIQSVWSCSDALQTDSDSITVDLQDIRQFDDDLYDLFRQTPDVAIPLVSSTFAVSASLCT
jgi:hypothetical protein